LYREDEEITAKKKPALKAGLTHVHGTIRKH